MTKAIPKILILMCSMAGVSIAGHVMWISWKMLGEMPPLEMTLPDTDEAQAADVSDPHAKASDGEHAKSQSAEHEEGKAAGSEGSADEEAAPAPVVNLDEMFVNILEGDKTHSLGIKLGLELFEDSSRGLIETRGAGVKDAIIRTAREQDFTTLNTIPGKLFFKETLVSRINQFLGTAAVRDVHFASFYLQ